MAVGMKVDSYDYSNWILLCPEVGRGVLEAAEAFAVMTAVVVGDAVER